MLRILIILLFVSYVCANQCLSIVLADTLRRPTLEITTIPSPTTSEIPIYTSIKIVGLGRNLTDIYSKFPNFHDFDAPRCFDAVETEYLKWYDCDSIKDNCTALWEFNDKTKKNVGQYVCNVLGDNFFGSLTIRGIFEDIEHKKTRDLRTIKVDCETNHIYTTTTTTQKPTTPNLPSSTAHV